MAKTTLPTNYVDDVLNDAMDGKRRYREIPNADGTISLEDATTYDQIGSNFGASQVNLMNDNINQSFDANKMLKTMDEVNAVEQEGYGVDALVVKQLNSSLTANSNQFYFDYQDGKYGFNTDPNRGADTFSPFSSGVNEIAFGWNGSNYGGGIIKKDGTTLGGTVSATTLNGNYVSLNIGTQYKEDGTYKGSITFTALVAGVYKIYENGTVTDKSVSANEVIYTKTMAGNNIPVSVVAM